MNNLRMLIVEDEFLSRKLVGHYVGRFGKADVAVNAAEALSAIEDAYRAKSPYDVVFLDIMMPDKSGLEALKEIRSMEGSLGLTAAEGMKVIMTTALGDAHSVAEAFENQCEAYITKPYTEEAFETQLRKLGLIG